MNSSAILREIQSIHKQGNLIKQSRILKHWRKRWVVVTNNLILTYKERRVYQSPTQVILLDNVIAISSADQEIEEKNCFTIKTKSDNFYLCSEDKVEKEAWVELIGKMIGENRIKGES